MISLLFILFMFLAVVPWPLVLDKHRLVWVQIFGFAGLIALTLWTLPK